MMWNECIAKQGFLLTNGLLAFLPTGEMYYVCKGVRDAVNRELQMVVDKQPDGWKLGVGFANEDVFFTEVRGFESYDAAMMYAMGLVGYNNWRIV